MTINFCKKSLVAAVLCASISACNSDDDDSGGSSNTDQEFAFSSAEFADYTRVDRSGMPAISTALIASKDSYNQADPADDAASTFVPEIISSLQSLHGALDGQLQGLGLQPCTVVGDGTGTCVAAAGPLIIPDTLSIDTSAAAGFPNGRLLTDPVMDVTLAVALLELTGDPAPHTAVSLVGVLNPTENDLPLQAAFPYLAAPHQ